MDLKHQKGLIFGSDISNILLIEPSNTSAQEEMKKLTTLIQQERAKVCLTN